MKRRPLLALTLLTSLATTASALTILDPGTVADADPVECGAHKGTVTARTGVHFQDDEVDFPDGVSFEFVATQGDALDCCWVQFVRAQGIAITDTATYSLAGTNVPTTGGEVILSTDATPGWHVDSAGKSPCYESRGSSVKDTSGTTMFDRPGNLAEFLVPGLPGWLGAKRVEVVLHFVAYLVCGRRVCATAVWTLKQSWRAAPGMGPGIATSALDAKPTVTPGGTIEPKQLAAADAEHAGQRILPP